MTFPVLFSLLDAYNEKRRLELQEQGAIAAIAHHDPSRLRELEARPQRAPGSKPPDWFDAYVKRS